jgi:hypothetical protein
MTHEQKLTEVITTYGSDGEPVRKVKRTFGAGTNQAQTPDLSRVRPKPKKTEVSDYPLGTIQSLLPLLDIEFRREEEGQEVGQELGRLDEQTMSITEACKLLITNKKSPKQVAQALLAEEPVFFANVDWKRISPEGQKGIESRLATRISMEYEKTKSS